MKQLRVGLIGLGKISQKHREALALLEKEGVAKLVAACDPVAERHKDLGAGVKAFTTHEAMLAGAEMDLVIIATPSGTHAELGMAVAQKKLHVVVEKPLTLNLQDADRLIECCSRHNVQVFEIKQNRFNRCVQKAREAIVQGRLGRVTTANAQVLWSRNQAYYDSAAWRGTWAMDGGVFANQAIHHLDLLVWLVGPVASVMAKGDTLLHKIEVEDTGVAIIKFVNGALATVQATVCARPKDIEGSVSIFGEKGSIKLGGFSADKLALWDFVDSTAEDKNVMADHGQNPPEFKAYAHYHCLKDICGAVINQRPAVIDGLEARKTLELLNAIYESMETGREVFLVFKPTHSKLGR